MGDDADRVAFGHSGSVPFRPGPRQILHRKEDPFGIGKGLARLVLMANHQNSKIAPRLSVGPTCLMFFIDETGHETFADPNYPVFGLGGCAITSSAIESHITRPWRAMKAQHFGGEDVALHASELRSPTPDQLTGLSRFFREQQFARFAVTMSRSLVLPSGASPFDIITGTLANRLKDILSRALPEPNEVALLHEASDRCDQLVEKHFGGMVVNISDKSVPVHKGLVSKSFGLPELEVADFIMHAAGRRALQLHRDPTIKPGKDFEVAFQSNPVLTSYIHVTECR